MRSPGAGLDREPKRRPAERQTPPPGGTRGWRVRTASGSIVPAASERLEEGPTTVQLDLEVARPASDAARELRGDPPAELLEGVLGGIPGREDGGPQPLEMAVLVADHRSDVMGRDDAATSVVEAAGDQDDAEVRQLVVGQPDRWPPELVEDLVERVGMDRRGQAVADRRGPDRDTGGSTPGIGRGVVGQLVGEQDGRRRADRVAAGCGGSGDRPASRAPTPAAASRRSRPRRRAPRPGWSAAGSRAARSSSVVLPTCCASAATTIGTWASTSSQTVAASSASSTPDPISSTIERRSGGTRRNAQRPGAGEKSATGGA